MNETKNWSVTSLVNSLKLLNEEERNQFLSKLKADQLEALRYYWPLYARPNQLAPPGQWHLWLVLAGRGYGKTRTGAEFVRDKVESGQAGRVAFIASTAGDMRDVMVEGESGIMNISRPSFMPKYEPSKRRLTWPNGAIATTFSAEEPKRLRGPQQDLLWCDEYASWRSPETLDMALMGLRLGKDPRGIVTTTPTRAKHVRALIENPMVAITRGTTYENLDNLAPTFRETVLKKYEGTRLGRQELDGEVLSDVDGALWKQDWIDESRAPLPTNLVKICVAVDPSIKEEGGDACGIVVTGVDSNGEGYVLADFTVEGSPDDWLAGIAKAINMWEAYAPTLDLVAEANQGGDLITVIMRQSGIGYKPKLVFATKGKYIRAEPVALLYEQKHIHHCAVFKDLEEELVNWVTGSDSPNRLDAVVWAFTHLFKLKVKQGSSTLVFPQTEKEAKKSQNELNAWDSPSWYKYMTDEDKSVDISTPPSRYERRFTQGTPGLDELDTEYMAFILGGSI